MCVVFLIFIFSYALDIFVVIKAVLPYSSALWNIVKLAKILVAVSSLSLAQQH